jgi:gamma-glutamyltranspeptidase
MALHDRFGRVPLDVCSRSAIAHAEDSFQCPRSRRSNGTGAMRLLRECERPSERTYLRRKAPGPGELFEIRISLGPGAIARTGGEAFYRGEVAQRILRAAPSRVACTLLPILP